ncbi:epoxide hydrolase N-terminal domain-containing protein [Streptomyces sp. NPDC003011]
MRRLVARDRPSLSPRVVAYWADGFDWPTQEAALAQLPRFRVPLAPRGSTPCTPGPPAPAGLVRPLILGHGRPESFGRYAKVMSGGAREQRCAAHIVGAAAGVCVFPGAQRAG